MNECCACVRAFVVVYVGVCTVCLYVGVYMHACIYNVLFVIHSCFMNYVRAV